DAGPSSRLARDGRGPDRVSRDPLWDELVRQRRGDAGTRLDERALGKAGERRYEGAANGRQWRPLDSRLRTGGGEPRGDRLLQQPRAVCEDAAREDDGKDVIQPDPASSDRGVIGDERSVLGDEPPGKSVALLGLVEQDARGAHDLELGELPLP